MHTLLESFEIDPRLLPAGLNEHENLEALKKLLISRIEELAQNDMEKLLWILYRIDVSEKKLKAALANAPPEDFSKTVADLIIERQIQKDETRRKSGEQGTEWNFDI